MPEQLIGYDTEGNPITEALPYPGEQAAPSQDPMLVLQDMLEKARARKEAALKSIDSRQQDLLPGYMKSDPNRSKKAKVGTGILQFLTGVAEGHRGGPNTYEKARDRARAEYAAETAATKTEESDIMRQIGLMTRSREENDAKKRLADLNYELKKMDIQAKSGMMNAKAREHLAKAKEAAARGDFLTAQTEHEYAKIEFTQAKTGDVGATNETRVYDKLQELQSRDDGGKAANQFLTMLEGMKGSASGQASTTISPRKVTDMFGRETYEMMPSYRIPGGGGPSAWDTLRGKIRSGADPAAPQSPNIGTSAPTTPTEKPELSTPPPPKAPMVKGPGGATSGPGSVDAKAFEKRTKAIAYGASPQLRAKAEEARTTQNSWSSITDSIFNLASNFDDNGRSHLFLTTGLRSPITSVKARYNQPLAAVTLAGSNTKAAIDQYRKIITGAAASLPELNRIAALFPKVGDNYDFFDSDVRNLQVAMAGHLIAGAAAYKYSDISQLDKRAVYTNFQDIAIKRMEEITNAYKKMIDVAPKIPAAQRVKAATEFRKMAMDKLSTVSMMEEAERANGMHPSQQTPAAQPKKPIIITVGGQ